MRWLAVLMTCALASCASVEEQRAAQVAADDQQCRSYGAVPGTAAYIQCRTTKDQQRDADRVALRTAIIDAPLPVAPEVRGPSLPPLPY